MKTRNYLLPFATILIASSIIWGVISLVRGSAVQAAPAAPTATRFVAPGGDCGGATPCYSTIQAAVNAASDGDTILVKGGRYVGVNNQGGADQALYLDKEVHIQGGYPPDDWDSNNLSKYPTILDANASGRVVLITGDISPTLEGLRLTNGLYNYNGVGIFSNVAHPIIKNCHIYNNTANSSYAGGIYIQSGHNAKLIGNKIYNNKTTQTNSYGGGVRLILSNNVLFEDNRIFENSTDMGGGGVSISSSSGVTLTNNTIYSNTSYWGSGIDAIASHYLVLDNNEVYKNHATIGGTGAAIYVNQSNNPLVNNNHIHDNVADSNAGGLALRMSDNATIKANYIHDNTALGSGSGGGMYIDDSDEPLIEDNFVSGNHADGSMAGGMYINYCYTPTLKNNIISNNTAGAVGGLRVSGRNGAIIEGNMIIGNIAKTNVAGGVQIASVDNILLKNNQILNNSTLFGYGGGIYFSTINNGKMENNIIASNTISTGNGAGIYIMNAQVDLIHTTLARNSGGNSQAIYIQNQSQPFQIYLTNTIVVSHTTGIEITYLSTATMTGTLWGTGAWANGTDYSGSGVLNTGSLNYWLDPDFIAPDEDNYHICTSSGALDNGVAAGVTSDIDGDTRPTSAGYDIGADEFGYDGVWVDRASGVDDISCGDKSSPCYSIQYAVGNIANYGDQVVVMPGTYTESFSMESGVHIVGACGPKVTFIDGEDARRPVAANGSSITETARLEGFTIQNGNAGVGLGGGMQSHGGSPSIDNCIFYNNQASYGGGISIQGSTSDVSIQDTKFISNAANSSGGGIYVNDSATLRLEDSQVISNTNYAGDTWGGGILGKTNSTLIISETLIKHNYAHKGGGILAMESTDLKLVDSEIISNTGDWSGGGIFVRINSTFNIQDNLIEDNEADDGAGILVYSSTGTVDGNILRYNVNSAHGGGGMTVDNANVTIDSNQFYSNTSLSHGGGGIRVEGASDFIISSNTFEHNLASTGGGILVVTGTGEIHENTLAFNKNTGDGGAGIYLGGGETQIYDNKIYSNTSLSHSGGGIRVALSAYADITSNLIEYNHAPSGGGIGIDAGQADVAGNTIRYNTTDGDGGAGIGVGAANVDIYSNDIFSNTSTSKSGGGIRISGGTDFNVWDNNIAYNTATGGAGIFVNTGEGSIIRNQIYKNQITGSGAAGIHTSAPSTVVIDGNWIADNNSSGISIKDKATVINNMLTGNLDKGGYQSQLELGGPNLITATNNSIVGGGTTSGIDITNNGAVTITNNIVVSFTNGIRGLGLVNAFLDYNDVWNNTADYSGVTVGTNDISKDPDFVNYHGRDFHLGTCSPAVDAGTNAFLPEQDFEQDFRPIDGNNDGNSVVDMGADERADKTAPLPVAGFTYLASGLDVTFTNTSSDSISYLWDFGDMSGTSTDTHPSYIYASAGDYTVTLSATCSFGCSDQYQELVTVTSGEPPADVTDLEATPGTLSGGTLLKWTAPGDDGSGGGPAAQYDMRYSSAPITEGNWGSATQLIGEPTPGTPGSQEQMSVGGLATGTRWYFALKTKNHADNWSDLSNVPSIQDIGLRPNPNGYNFANYTAWAYTDFTYYDMKMMFGQDPVCYWWFFCWRTKFAARAWYWYYLSRLGNGVADGMATTSLRFFKNLDNPSTFQAGATNAYQLTKANARRNIAYYQVLQYTNPVAKARYLSRQNTPATILAQLQAAMTGAVPDPVVLFIKFGSSGHSLTPYALEELADGTWRAYVYDSNHANTLGRYVEIDPTANTWSFNTGWAIWSGNSSTHSLGTVPISKYAETPIAPWYSYPTLKPEVEAETAQVWLQGKGHLLISDSQNRQIGFDNTDFVSEIPGAYETVSSGGGQAGMEPVYTIPLSETYTILLDGQTLTETAVVSVTQFGPGYATGISGVVISSTIQKEIVIAADGSSVVYTSTTGNEVSLHINLEGDNEGWQFLLDGVDVSAGETISLTVETSSNQLVLVNQDSSTGTYDLHIETKGSGEEKYFSGQGISIPAGATHFIKFGNWEGGEMTIEVDENSDGSIDGTIQIGNQAPLIYLPYVMKQKK